MFKFKDIILKKCEQERIKPYENISKFYYPKLVIISGKRNILVQDVKSCEENREFNKDFYLRTDSDIVDVHLQEQLIWILLDSSQLIAIDILTGDNTVFTFDDCHYNVNFMSFKTDGTKFYLASKNDGYLSIPYSITEIRSKLKNSKQKINLEKVRLNHIPHAQNYYDCLKAEQNATGLQLEIERDTLIVMCPITGLRAVSASTDEFEWKYVLPWGELAALTDGVGIWLVGMVDTHIQLELNAENTKYIPLASWEDLFYYLQFENNEVQIHCVQKYTNTNEEEILPGVIPNNGKDNKLQVVLKDKLINISDSIVNNRLSPTESFKELQQLFGDINDLSFLLCKGTILCEHDLYYRNLLESLHTRAQGDDLLSRDIYYVISKIEIIEYIHLIDNRKYDNSHILQSNLIDICCTFVRNSDLDLASIAWVKMYRIQKKITSDDIVSILNATPHNIKLNSFLLWLKHFIPSILDENPFYIDVFVNWTTNRVFFLEKSPYWPKIGIKFIDEILCVLNVSQRKFITIRPTSLDDLDVLKVHVSKISELKEKYKINMLLGELSSLIPGEVALIMLQRCYIEDLESFLHDYLASFAVENFLELDNILKDYIECETSDNGGGADEARLGIILGAFHMDKTKLECLLDVLRTLDVPWSSGMRELALNCATIKDKDFTLCDTDLQLIQQIKMEIYFANLKVVLKKYNTPFNSTDYVLLINKIVSMPNVDVIDLRIVMQSMSSFNCYGSILYIDRCLKDCSVKKALQYFKTLTDINKKILLKSIITKYELIINGCANDSAIERCYLDFIKGTHLLHEKRLSKLEDMYYLKNSYNIIINLNDMSNEKAKTQKITKWFSVSGEKASSARGVCVTRLAHLSSTFTTTLVDILSQISANAEVQSHVESFITTFTNCSISPCEINSLLINFKESHNSSMAWDCCLLLVQLIYNCPEDYLHLLASVLTIYSALVNTSIKVKHFTIAWKLHYFFVPMSNISSTDNLIKYYIDILAENFNQDSMHSVSFRSDLVPFRIFSAYIYKHLSVNIYLDNIFIDIKEKFAKKMVSNILLSQECDELLLACSLLLLNSTSEHQDGRTYEWLLKTFEGYGDAIPAAISRYLTSSTLCRALDIENVINIKAGIGAPYHILKTKYNLNFADLALPDITEDTWDAKIILYYILKNYPNTSISTLVDYCNILHVDLDDGLSMQLITILVDWELKYKLHSDDFELGMQIQYKNDENELFSICFVVWESIKNKNFIIDILKDFWQKGEVSLHGHLVSTNPYYYEIYLCIYKLIGSHIPEWINSNEYLLLHFLRDYKRTSLPKQYEFELFSIKGLFPEIGHYRLPFHLFMRDDMWSNLKWEITLATYEKWLPLAMLLCLDSDLQISRDMLCSNALKQTMTARKQRNETKIIEKHNDSWRLEPTEEPLLRAAHRCVRHIANMEWAGACLFYVLQGCARGADQVAAAQLCYDFAQCWSALQPVNRAVLQMQKLYCTLSTRHALHKIDWACEDLLRFSGEPTQLVRAIYFHPDFINKMTRYDVNRTVDEIADKNNINISSVRIQILENILERNSKERKCKSQIGLENEELMHAKFILKATCPKMGAMYLARIALEDETDFNKRKKMRALQCLISIVEPDTALKVTNTNREALLSSLIDLFFTINLEDVDMPWAVATFAKDKLRTLEQVCSASENGVEGLKLAAELSVRYGNAHNSRLIILRLLAASLYDVLSVLLCNTYIYPDDFVCRAWSAVLLSPFQNADYPVTECQRRNCLTAVNMLPLCPYISDDDLNILWRNCIRIKCYGIGCLILPFMSLQSRKLLPELKKIDKRNLIAGVKNLQTETYLINGALAVLENSSLRK